MTSTSHIAQRLLTTYDDMPRGERKLADLLLEDVGIIGQSTAADLATQAGVSKATAARLFRRLGYSGYRDAQREQREVRNTGRPVPPVLALSGSTLSPGEFLDAEVKNLVRYFESLQPAQVDEAVRMLCSPGKLWVVGFGEDYRLAFYARSMLIRVFADVQMIPLSGFPVPEEFASIKPDDTVLAFGVGRRNPELRNIIGSSRRAGARTILVTNTLAPGDKSGADVILRGRSDAASLFGSMTAPVSLISYLCARVAAEAGDSAVQRLEHIESIHSQWAEESGKSD